MDVSMARQYMIDQMGGGIEDYSTIFISSVFFTVYIIMLNNGQLDDVKSYLRTKYGQLILILLILLVIQRNIQIGLMIALAFMLTLVDNKNVKPFEGFKDFDESYENLSKAEEAEEEEETDEEYDDSSATATSIENLQDDIDNILKGKKNKSKSEDYTTRSLASKIKSTESFKDLVSKVTEHLNPQIETFQNNKTNKTNVVEPFVNYSGNYYKY